MYVIKYDLSSDKYVIKNRDDENQSKLFPITTTGTFGQKFVSQFNGKIMKSLFFNIYEIYFENIEDVKNAVEWLESILVINELGGA